MTPPVNTAICLASPIRHRAINNLFLKAKKKKGTILYTFQNRQGEYDRMGVLKLYQRKQAWELIKQSTARNNTAPLPDFHKEQGA